MNVNIKIPMNYLWTRIKPVDKSTDGGSEMEKPLPNTHIHCNLSALSDTLPNYTNEDL